MDREREYYGADHEWPRQAQARYDPENVFYLAQIVSFEERIYGMTT
ncbi:BBE domain-containing protein [Nocardia sp. CA-135398]